MKKSLLLVLAMLVTAAALPLAVFAGRIPSEPFTAAAQTTIATSVTPASAVLRTTAIRTVATTATSAEPPASEPTIAVMVDGIRTEMDVEAAVVAIVAAEMPALFPVEALKAQAVAARTYVAYRAAHPVSAHAEAVICDDPSHCCALADLDALAVGWGTSGQDYAARIVAAVEATAGEILTYEGEPIMAVFHAMSAAQTNSAADVWGGAVDYLVSVAAPEAEEEPERYRDSAVFAADEFRTYFLAEHPDAKLDLQLLNWFSDFDYAESGLLRAVSVGGVRVSGQALRSLCGLRSAAMTITQGTDRIRFDTVGYGHGVGMSQHGAKIFAQQGLSYRAILAHYYVGCELV